jgi:hypothetical protein
MATPLRSRGAKSLANLKRGGTNRRPKKSVSDEARRLSRKLLSDPTYRKTLNKRLRAGTIQPGVEALLYYYAYGKPKETIETTPPADIKIVHQYDDTPPTRTAPPKLPKKT